MTKLRSWPKLYCTDRYQNYHRYAAESVELQCSHPIKCRSYDGGRSWTENICRVHSKLKVQNSRTFKDPNCIFQAPKLWTKSHILDADIQNLDCNVTLKWNQILFPSTGDMHTSACFKTVNKYKICKIYIQGLFKDFQVLSSTLSVFKHFQRPWSFYSKFKHIQGFLKHALNPVYVKDKQVKQI